MLHRAYAQLGDMGLNFTAVQRATHVGLDTTHPALHLVNLYSGWGFQHRATIQWPGKDYASVVMILELAPTP